MHGICSLDNLIHQSEPVGQHQPRVAVVHLRMQEPSRASSKKVVVERRIKRRKKKVIKKAEVVPTTEQLQRLRDLLIDRKNKMKEVRTKTQTTHAPTSSVTSS